MYCLAKIIHDQILKVVGSAGLILFISVLLVRSPLPLVFISHPSSCCCYLPANSVSISLTGSSPNDCSPWLAFISSQVTTAFTTTYPHSQTGALWSSRHLQMTTTFPNSKTQRPPSLCASELIPPQFPHRPGALEVRVMVWLSLSSHTWPQSQLIMGVFSECMNQ